MLADSPRVYLSRNYERAIAESAMLALRKPDSSFPETNLTLFFEVVDDLCGGDGSDEGR